MIIYRILFAFVKRNPGKQIIWADQRNLPYDTQAETHAFWRIRFRHPMHGLSHPPCDAEMRLSLISHSNKEINAAGRALFPILERREFPPSEASVLIPATMIVADWRNTFAYPLRVVSSLLRHHAKSVDNHALVSSRMKRLESMIVKLKRNPSMQITQMQDVGGCRAILGSIDQVHTLAKRFRDEIAPRLQEPRENDYISQPKDDGYRSVHLVVRYHSRSYPEVPPRRIEIQLRSQLQHQWATAVETVDLFTRQTLKIGGGNPEWKRFFALASTLFALKENAVPVPDTPIDREQVIAELRLLWKGLRVPSLLYGWTDAMRSTEVQSKTGGPFDIYLVSINTEAMVTGITAFKNEDVQAAQQMYAQVEQNRLENPNLNAVLVSVAGIGELRKAFPNYYGDTASFVDEIGHTIHPLQ